MSFLKWMWNEWPLAILVVGALLFLGINVLLCELGLPTTVAHK